MPSSEDYFLNLRVEVRRTKLVMKTSVLKLIHHRCSVLLQVFVPSPLLNPMVHACIVEGTNTPTLLNNMLGLTCVLLTIL